MLYVINSSLLKVLTGVLGFVTMGLLTAQPVFAQAADQPREIRIAYSSAGAAGRPLGGGNPLAVAHQHQLFEDEFAADGIKIVWNFFPGAGPATNEATARGLIDFGHHGDLPVIVGRSTGLKHKIVAALGRFGDTHFVVPSGSTARSLEDLRGKKISTFKGTAGQLTLARVLAKYGYTEKDFRVISLNGETTRASLTTGDIDGSITAPYSLEARGVAKRLFTIDRDPDITSVTSFWVSEDFEEKYPDITQRLVTTLVKAAHWASLEENREDFFALSARQGVTTYDDYQQGYASYTLKERHSPLLDEYFAATIQRSIDHALEYKLIRRPVSIDGWIEPKYLLNALDELELQTFWDEYDDTGKIKNVHEVVSADQQGTVVQSQ